MDTQPRHYVLGAGLIFLTTTCALMLGMAYKQDQMLRRQTYDRASALHDLIIVARRWNANHGGVYAKAPANTPTGRSFPGWHVRDASGRFFEKMSPEVMTREISEYAASEKNFSLHITSLMLMNPSNAPDAWEEKILAGFDRGETERFEVANSPLGLRYRLMRPLYVEKSCLPCHGPQGYKIGDVRGGISVSLPFDAVSAALRWNIMGMVSLAILLFVLIVLTLYFFVWRLMDKLEKLNGDLAELNKTKDSFLGMAAHDLRNPLASVVWFAEILKEDAADPSQREILDTIIQSSERMLGMINDLLDVAQINQGHLDLKVREVSVEEMLAKALRINAPIARRKGITLERDIPADIGAACLDSDRILQVLDNLIGNAIKYSKSGSVITVGARRDATTLSIWVEDQGVGIKQEDLPKLFQEFSKTASRPTAGESSHGLGLAIAKRLVEMHGGTLEVRSEAGRGARFTANIPLTVAGPRTA